MAQPVRASRFSRVSRPRRGYLADVIGDAPHDRFSDELQRALHGVYVLQRELAGGGMSRVFVATEVSLQRDVVIKVLPPELAAGVNRERFRREIQLAAALQHPHIVPLLSSGESGELLWYTMPFIRGESLRSTIEQRGALPVAEVIRILHEVVDALAYAHARGVIHRDIKPANVLMSGTHAVITDFGVAKALGASLSAISVTSSGIAIGTPAYMAPEQLAGDPAADARVDVYAVGLLAYELLTGKSPFAGRTSPQAMLTAQLTETPAPLDRAVPDLSSGLARLIMRALEKNPDARPRSAQELHAELDALTSPEGAVCVPEPARRSRPTRRVVAAITAVATIAIVSVLASTLTNRTADSPASTATMPPVDSTRVAATQQGAPALTHADSLAIAAAVQARFDSARRKARARPTAAGSVDLDSLRVQIERAVADSMRTLARRRSTRGLSWDSISARLGHDRLPLEFGPAAFPDSVPGAPLPLALDAAALRRVAVTASLSLGGPPALTEATRAMADSLRVQLLAAGFDVVDAESPRIRGYRTNDPLRLARANHAAVGITGIVMAQEGDSIAYMVMVGDLRRGQSVRTFTGGRAPASAPLTGIGRFAAAIVRIIERAGR